MGWISCPLAVFGEEGLVFFLSTLSQDKWLWSAHDSRNGPFLHHLVSLSCHRFRIVSCWLPLDFLTLFRGVRDFYHEIFKTGDTIDGLLHLYCVMRVPEEAFLSFFLALLRSALKAQPLERQYFSLYIFPIVLVKHILYYAVLIALNMSFRSSLYSVWSPVKQFYLCFRKCKCNYRTHSNISRNNSRDTYFDKIMHLLFLDLHFHLWLVPRIFLFCSFTLVYQCSIAVFSEACPFLYSVRFKLYVIS